MNNDGTADLFLPNGEKMNVTLDAQGMLAARQGYNEQSYVCRPLKIKKTNTKEMKHHTGVSSPFFQSYLLLSRIFLYYE